MRPAPQRRRDFALLGMLALVECWPVLSSGQRWGFWDWDVFEALFEAGRRSVLEFGQMPGWNPWLRGGEPLDAHPMHPFASPAFALALALGTLPAIKLWILVRACAALWGAYRLGEGLGYGRIGALAVAIGFGLASTFALRVGHGHWNLQAVVWLPWLARAGLDAFERGGRRDVARVAAWLALLLVDGDPYTFVMGSLLLGALAGVAFVRGRRRAPVALLAAGALAAGLCAVKLLPVLDAYGGGMRERRYGTEGRVSSDFYQPGIRVSAGRILWQALLARDQALDFGERATPFYINVGAYIGWLGLGAAAAGAALGGTTPRVALALALPVVWLVLGSAAPLNLWAALHHLPVWSSMTIPSKFSALYLLALAVMAGAGFDALWRRFVTRRAARIALGLVLTAWACDLLSVSRPVFAYAFPFEALPIEMGSFRQVARSPFEHSLRAAPGMRRLPQRPLEARHSLSTDYPGVRANLGTLDTYSGQPFPVFAHPDAGSGPTLGVRGGEGPASAVLRRWSPNELVVALDAARGGELLVNHDHHPNWSAQSAGRNLPVRSEAGRLVVGLDGAGAEVRLRYRSAPARVGLGISLASLALALFIARRRPLPPA